MGNCGCCEPGETAGYYEGQPTYVEYTTIDQTNNNNQAAVLGNGAAAYSPQTFTNGSSVPYGQGDARGSLVDSLQGLSSLPNISSPLIAYRPATYNLPAKPLPPINPPPQYNFNPN